MEVRCHLCQRTDSGTHGRLYESGWEWFTGYNDSRTDVCPDCCKVHRDRVDDLRIEAYSPTIDGSPNVPGMGRGRINDA